MGGAKAWRAKQMLGTNGRCVGEDGDGALSLVSFGLLIHLGGTLLFVLVLF